MPPRLSRRRAMVSAMAAAAGLAAPRAQAQGVSPAEARAIARDAFVYGFPMVDHYRVQHAYFVDRAGGEYKGPWNQVHSTARVYTPSDQAIQTPNADTPYSQLGADLRAEPLVLTLPPVEAGRYYGLQFVDAYTFNFAYAGSRTTGNGPGRLLLAGPRWRGPTPPGVSHVVRSETDLVFVFYRTQLFGPDDIGNVRRIQAGYTAEPLSHFLGRPAPTAPPPIDFVEPLDRTTERASLEVFRILNFLLRYCPTHPTERALMDRFARIGVGAGRPFDASTLTPDMTTALQAGIADAWRDYGAEERKFAAGTLTSGDVFGTRAYLRNNYLRRMVGAADGIYGNSREEAIYPGYLVDSAGERLGGQHAYALHFPPGGLPPVNAFWSLTMYDARSRMLVSNPLERYLINSAMLPGLLRDADGGLTLRIQHSAPEPAKAANWLPAPEGPFFMAMRLFWPKPEAYDGRWAKPPLQRLD